MLSTVSSPGLVRDAFGLFVGGVGVVGWGAKLGVGQIGKDIRCLDLVIHLQSHF